MTARKKAAANGAGTGFDWRTDDWATAEVHPADRVLAVAETRRQQEATDLRDEAAIQSASIQRDAKEAAMKAIRQGDGPVAAAEVLTNGVAAAWQLEIGAGL